MEMVIVIAMLALLAGVMVTELTGIFDTAQEDVEKQKVQTSLPEALLRYKIHIGSYPATEEGLQALVTPAQTGADRWRGPYLKKEALLDAWNKPYQYVRPGTHNPSSFDLWSYGPNGVNDNGGGDDIGNWSNAAAGSN
jgi:general secretion pathway protein G